MKIDQFDVGIGQSGEIGQFDGTVAPDWSISGIGQFGLTASRSIGSNLSLPVAMA
jgi:hypothetical protein